MSTPLGNELRDRFLSGMSHAACTVNVVTTDGPGGRAGVTVSAMASVSADTPRPTLLVCVHHQSPAAAKIIENGVFCVNVLRDDQSYISDTFAGRFKDEVGDKFECTDWTACGSGAPRISDGLVAFDCRLLSGDRVGTHYVFLGEVDEIYRAQRGSPLIYANRAYGKSSRIEGVRSLKAAKAVQAEKLNVGYFHTFGPYIMPGLMAHLPDIDFDLVEGDHRRLRESLASGEIEIAMLYDLDLDNQFETQVLTELKPYVLLPDSHPFAAQAEITPQELAEEPVILLDSDPSRAYFQRLMKTAGVTPLVAHHSPSFEMVRGMVGHGLGYALLATKPASNMSYDGMQLAVRPLAGTHESSRVVLAHRAGHELSSAATRFAAECRSQFEPSLAK